ncbi:Uncharacterised protein [Serratia fonticola]|uniref:Uncharacterized protein n=1 Tax=Serratia fonticola TaxID=47917 RepID=A0A4U9VEU8_SERFO|nr:Uncharacterised protein [Serratia fonticola]
MENTSTVEPGESTGSMSGWTQGVVAQGASCLLRRELEELLGIKRMTLRQALLFLEGESKILS